MSRVASAVLLLLAASAPAGAHAEVFKCTEPDGRKVYQDRPCTAGQTAAAYDPATANVTTIDSQAASREAQEALVTREAGREAREEQERDRRVAVEPTYIPVPVYEPEPVYYPYPVYLGDGHHHHHDRPRVPLRPDPTPMSDPARRGGGYAPDPPTIRDVAPRPPSSRGERRSSRDER